MNLEYDIPDLSQLSIEYKVEDPGLSTTAEIEKYYPELKQSWEIGEQQATVDGIPLSREYSSLRFESDHNTLDLVELGFNSDEYEGSRYYRVTSKFQEREYYSARDAGYENFLKWELSENEFLQEIIYKHEKVGEVRWDRPYTIIPYGTGPIDPLTEAAGPPVPLYSIRGATATSTGVGAPVMKLIGPEETLIQWDELSIPYKRLARGGSGLSAVISSDGSFKVYLRSTPTSVERTETSDELILLRKEYLEIEFIKPTVNLPTYIKIEFYGKELWRSFAPIRIDDEAEVLVHPLSATQEERYKPPGMSDLPDNFWNNNPLDRSNLEGFINRQGSNAGWHG